MSNRILTRDEWLAYCKEVADKFNADLTPKKVWISDMGGWFATESSCDTPYIRADIVDGLVEALEKIAALEDTEEDEWDGVERVIPLMASTAKTALIVIFGGLAFSDYNKTQIELAKIEMLKRLRDERDALLKDVSALVDDDFGANGWSNEMDSAAMRLRKLVGKMRADYDE
jgi:hypothetical protein